MAKVVMVTGFRFLVHIYLDVDRQLFWGERLHIVKMINHKNDPLYV